MSVYNIGPVLLKEIEGLAKEKFLDKEALLSIFELAFSKIYSKHYGTRNDIRVSIHPETGDINLTRHRLITDEVTCPFKQIHSKDTLNAKGKIVDGEWVESLPLLEFSRSEVSSILKTLQHETQEMERKAQYEEFKSRVGEMVSVTVKRLEGRNVVVDLGRAEGIILRSELLKWENYSINDRLKAYIYAVRREQKGPQIFLSRTHSGFLHELFVREVDEIAQGLIEIKGVVRDPGSRAKVAVFAYNFTSKGRNFSPVGTCVGIRGNRVKAIQEELKGEQIDVVLWSQETPEFIVNALSSVEVLKVVVEKGTNQYTVVVPDGQKNLAIGREGQNVSLVCKLTGTNINIMSASEEQKKRSQDLQERMGLFVQRLDLDEFLAHFLVLQGFESLQDIVFTSQEELMQLEGFTLEIAQELRARALEALEEEEKNHRNMFVAHQGDPKLMELCSPYMLEALVANKILTLKDFSELSLEELEDYLKGVRHGLSSQALGDLIMKARTLCA
ncbi:MULTISPECIES: transcription termination factor NusA [Holospora]|uniref:Transcription termination/antitermination protein NusA n=2 Tax=Holospora TaxID=44747 RepID=A0A061JG90_9PROT|nr:MULTISPECIES: transcription termination factor NusA [Holospora]ETZ04900.1 transcription termination/antitermination protein NusA [Holospora undulata HU1]GAJ46403.1 transcription termination/antitermination protein NusA [Holospora elegans E1]